MRKIGMIITVLAAALLLSAAAFAEDKAVEANISIGGSWTLDDIDTDEEGAKGTEYMTPVENNAYIDLKGDIKAEKDGIAFEAEGHYQFVDEQEYKAGLDLRRILTLKTDYNRFIHRLDHDELENLEAHVFSTTGAGLFYDFNGDGTNNKNDEIIGSAAVYHSDYGAGDDYYLMRAEWKNEAKLHIPQIPGLTIGFNHRFEERKGLEQARTMSKCSACHVVADSKSIDEETNDYMPSVTLRTGPVVLNYTFMHREFDDQSEEMTNVYNALAASHLGFTNRLQFDDRTGALPYSSTPDSEKDMHTFKARWNVNRHNTFTAAVVYSQITNTSVDDPYDPLNGGYGDEIEMESTTMSAKWHSRISSNLSLNVHGRYQTIDNDEVYIDVVDRTNGDGTTLGDGYATSTLGAEEGLGTGYWDFTRRSGYDLDLTTLGFDVAWRPMLGVTIRGGYEFHYEERDNAEYHHVPDDTTEHSFKLSGDWRVNRTLKLGLAYRLELVDDPYSLEEAVCTPDGSYGEYGGPPGSLYDYSRSYDPAIYSQRVGSRSNQPNSAHEFRFKGSWMPTAILSANFNAKYRTAENDDIDGNEWQQDLFTGGVNVVLAPNDKVSFMTGYNYFNDKYEAMYCIAIYDG